MSEVEVLIPHHGGRDSLRAALDALRRQTVEAGVCVLDNASADGSREMVETGYPSVRLLSFECNLGFGAALNIGVRSSGAAAVCLLNNDAEPDPRFVEELLAAAERAGAEAVAGCLRLADGSIDSAGVHADRSLIAYDHLHGQPFPPPGEPPPPLGPCGGAALFERKALLRLGGFDEGFFAYLEDVDLALRLRLAGMSCALAPRAFAWHRHAGTLGAGSTDKNRLLGRGRGRLLWKYGRALAPSARMRGLFVDAVTYTGQIALDRNVGAIRGRLEERRSRRGLPRPAAPDLGPLPLLELSAAEALRLRWGRGRRYRGTA